MNDCGSKRKGEDPRNLLADQTLSPHWVYARDRRPYWGTILDRSRWVGCTYPCWRRDYCLDSGWGYGIDRLGDDEPIFSDIPSDQDRSPNELGCRYWEAKGKVGWFISSLKVTLEGMGALEEYSCRAKVELNSVWSRNVALQIEVKNLEQSRTKMIRIG